MKKTVFTVLFLFLATISHALTLAEIRSEVRYAIKDSTKTVNTPRWTDDALNKKIDIIQRQIAVDTRCIYKEERSTPTANTSEYSMPTDCYIIDRVAYLSASSVTATMQYKKLEPWTLPGLDISYQTYWENLSAGLPTMYAEKGNSIVLVPKPSAVYCSTGAIKWDYFAIPETVSEDSDEPWNGLKNLYGYQYLIIRGVAISCLEDEGYEISTKKQIYDVLIQRMTGALLDKPDMKSSNIPVR